ncbi:MAG: hypothetical protein KAT53_09255, partial [Dehalococcoidia bacterium]|nr:hypothetical protein [Dehalococcoidia bacterium]
QCRKEAKSKTLEAIRDYDRNGKGIASDSEESVSIPEYTTYMYNTHQRRCRDRASADQRGTRNIG